MAALSFGDPLFVTYAIAAVPAARILLYGYVASPLLHTAVYLTKQTHEASAAFWTVGFAILIYITVRSIDLRDRGVSSQVQFRYVRVVTFGPEIMTASTRCRC